MQILFQLADFFTPHCLEFIPWKLSENLSVCINIGAYPRAPNFDKMLVRYWGVFWPVIVLRTLLWQCKAMGEKKVLFS